MKEVDQIIHAKLIILCDDANTILEQHALAIKAGKIEAILPSHSIKDEYSSRSEIHYQQHAVMPGFINSHTHLPMNIFRGLADDLTLLDWLRNYIWPAETKWVSDDMVYDGTLLAMAEMIRSGTTCFNDMYFFPEAIARAAEVSGMRAHVGMTIIDVPTAYAKTPDEYLEKSTDFYHTYKNHDLITPTWAPHSAYTVSLKTLEKVNDLANQMNLKINMHLQESPAEITESLEKHHARPLKRLEQIGMVTDRLIAIHMTQINQDDWEILSANKPHIVHCPESNMKLVSGICPVEQCKNLGINVALGTDGAASNNDLDMITEMRTAAFLGKLGANNPKAVSAVDALKMATQNAAIALGKEHLIGSLAKGKSADFIAIDLYRIETEPLYHPISQIVYSAGRDQITDVWVAGRQLLKNRQLQTLDEQALLQKAQLWRNKIKNSV